MGLCISTVCGAETISGRVVNGTASPLSVARVWLKNDPAVSDSTGTDGKFSLSIPSTGTVSNHISDGVIHSISIRNNRLDFSLTSPQNIRIEIFNISGKKEATILKGMLGQGTNSIALGQKALSLANGAYFLRFASKETLFDFRLTVADHMLFAHASMDNSQRKSNATAKIAAAADSLIVLRMGYAIKKMSLATLATQDLGDIALAARTYKVDTTVTVKTGRTIEVIVPSDHEDLYTIPVLYLLHGGGEDHTAWRTKGCLIDTLNKFRNKDSMVAMIIVTPDAASSANYGNYGKTGDAFYTDLTVDIRKWVESHYKVDTSRFGRGISGFSMGAMQTHNFALFYPKVFGYAFSLCGGLYTCSGFSEAKMKSDIASGAIDTAAVNSMKRYRLYSNPTDIAYTNGDTPNFEKFLCTVGIKHTYDFTSYSIGGHTYSYDNVAFQKYAVMIFK